MGTHGGGWALRVGKQPQPHSPLGFSSSTGTTLGWLMVGAN